jgi:hypothetical protein
VTHQSQFRRDHFFNLAPGVALSDAVTAIDEGDAATCTACRHSRKLCRHGASVSSFAEERTSADRRSDWSVSISCWEFCESYIHPLTILSTLPSAGVGAMLALMLPYRFEFDRVDRVILLIGIVKKNAIMMIDFASLRLNAPRASPAKRRSIKPVCSGSAPS